MTEEAPFSPEVPRDVAVLRLDRLGDAILTTGLLATLRAAWPWCRISVLCTAATAMFYSRCPPINSVVVLPAIPPAELAAPQNQGRLQKFLELYGGRFDLLVNPRCAPDRYSAAAYAAASGASKRLAFRQVDFIQGFDPNGAYTHLIDLPAVGEHVAVAAGRLLSPLGIAAALQPPRVLIGSRERARASAALGSRRCVAFGIGAGEPYKIWPPKNFAEVAHFLAAKKYTVVLLGAEGDRPLANELRYDFDGEIIDLVGMTTIEESAGIIERCVMFVGTDSGPMHLAAAVGTPVLTIDWLTENSEGFDYDRAFAPYNTQAIRVSAISGFSFQRTIAGDAIRSITPAQVIDALRAGLEAINHRA